MQRLQVHGLAHFPEFSRIFQIFPHLCYSVHYLSFIQEHDLAHHHPTSLGPPLYSGTTKHGLSRAIDIRWLTNKLAAGSRLLTFLESCSRQTAHRTLRQLAKADAFDAPATLWREPQRVDRLAAAKRSPNSAVEWIWLEEIVS